MARKISGGKYHKAKKANKTGRKKHTRLVKLGDRKKKVMRTRGGKDKVVLLTVEKANVLNKKTKKAKVVKIKSVLETPANRFLRKILIKGAIIDTEAGKAKITNRPGQEGSIQAILID